MRVRPSPVVPEGGTPAQLVLNAVDLATAELLEARSLSATLPPAPDFGDLRRPVMHAVRAAAVLHYGQERSRGGVPSGVTAGVQQAIFDVRAGLRELRVPFAQPTPDLDVVFGHWDKARVSLAQVRQLLQPPAPAVAAPAPASAG